MMPVGGSPLSNPKSSPPTFMPPFLMSQLSLLAGRSDACGRFSGMSSPVHEHKRQATMAMYVVLSDICVFLSDADCLFFVNGTNRTAEIIVVVVKIHLAQVTGTIKVYGS